LLSLASFERATMAPMTSLFGPITPFAGDPILSLNEACGHDPRPNKVNLSIGIYTDENGKIPVLGSVKQAVARLEFGARPYLPMEGHAGYRSAVQSLVFGADHEAVTSQRIATVQTIGGTGAVGIAADFLNTHRPGRTMFVSDPSWENHHGLFQRAGFTTKTFPWWNVAERTSCREQTVEAISNLPSGSIVVLQPVCHNPTGIDLTRAQQDAVTQLCIDKEHIVLFDVAYQGFGDGIDEDADWIRRCASAGMTFMVANSFSKNLSLYGERCGGLSVVCPTAEEAELVLGQLKFAIRRSYSNAPMSGGTITAEVLNSPDLRPQWEDEVGVMRDRMKAMRTKLVTAVAAVDPSLDTSFLTTQRGMFSYTGLTAEAVHTMRTDDGVYLIESGRMCVSGLNDSNVEAVAVSLARALQTLTN
jgi:aromatic-amino-acid transaminase